jgi:probable rRNA maturation factor
MVDVIVDDDVTLEPALRRTLARQLGRMVRAAALFDGRNQYEVALRLTGDPAIRELNRAYRDKDKPTDVLAFAQSEGPAAMLNPSLLGDIVISVPTAERQATRGLAAELLHLASHGLCHLLGYDHQTDREEAEMNKRAGGLRREARRTGRVRMA